MQIIKYKKPLIVSLAIVFTIFLYLNGNFNFSTYFEKEYRISAGDEKAFYRLSLELKKDTTIRSSKFLRVMARISGLDKKVNAGYYDLNNHMSTLGILIRLAFAQPKNIQISILEGYDIYDIADLLLSNQMIINKRTFISEMKSHKWKDKVADILSLEAGNSLVKVLKNSKNISIEGFIYPDTYFIIKGDSYDTVMELAIENFNQKIFQTYKNNLNSTKFYRALIAASLIEKETSVPHERPLVSSVLHNRLKIGQKLRFDPTIIYALKTKGLDEVNKKSGRINIKRSHFTLASPYNTYYRKGLPPNPICSPTKESFDAALSPAITDYFFFVAKGGDSKEHVFTKTYEEHLKFVNKYLQMR